MTIDELSQSIIGAAIAVHRELGPGLLESIYENCLALELAERGLRFARQERQRLSYKGKHIESTYRLDMLVDDRVVVEVKSIARFEPVHTAQMLTYLKLSGCQLGLLINFNVPLLKDGLKRVVLGLPESRQRRQREGHHL